MKCQGCNIDCDDGALRLARDFLWKCHECLSPEERAWALANPRSGRRRETKKQNPPTGGNRKGR